jgi:hypothetical protein
MSASRKNLPVKYLVEGGYLSEAPSTSKLLFGVVKQFCMFGIWSNTQCITPEYALHITQSPPSPLLTVKDVRRLYLFTQGRGGGALAGK